MATHYYVRLLGILRKSPKFLKLGNSTAAMFSLIVLNKSRSEKDTFYYNVPTILTDDEEMVSAIQDETVSRLYSVRLRKAEEVKRERVAKGMVENVGGDGTAPKKQPVKVNKIGRNDPCPCGSGLKWKKCTCKEYHDN